MQIKNIKINGIRNPMGFNLDKLTLSYYIEGEADGDFILYLYESRDSEQALYMQSLDYRINYCSPIDFSPNKETRYWFDIVCGGYRSERCFFETGTDFDSPFITPSEDISHPVVFREFNVDDVEQARLYVTGLGLYEARVNGQRVGNEYLTPDCNDYDAYVQYQTYDITHMLATDNILEIALGNGWYKGRFGLKKRENIYGSDYICAAKIVVMQKDGTRREINTDETWFARASHTVSSGIYDGEVVDDTSDCNRICSVKLCTRKNNVVERVSLPVVVKKQIKPVCIKSRKGEQILDFGQNFSGFVSFRCDLAYGQTIRLQAGEILQGGCFYRENLRTAKAEFVYTSDGTKKDVYPRFTFYGFRYMLVEGMDHVNAEDFIGNVLYSDLDDTIDISTDNTKINRLLLNCLWGQRSNFVDVPTDCPQRDERLGWTGDAVVFCATACYQMDCRMFYEKYLRDMEIDQIKYGGITTYSPSMKEYEPAFTVWSDAATIIPWTKYQFYGNKRLLERNYPMMERYVESIIAKDDARGGSRLYNFGFHLGDWLSQDGVNPSAFKGATSEYFIASCYYYNSVKIISQAAETLGYTESAKRYKTIQKEIRQAILNEYFTASGRLSVDTQTAYVLCVMFDIYLNRQKLISGFRKRMEKDCYTVKGGFVGATRLVQALVKSGLTEDAFRVVYSEKILGWLHSVNLGATTIWERWNSLNADGTVSGAELNSFNHYSFGSVAEAFYGYFAGLRQTDVAFKTVVIEPQFNYRLKKLDFVFRSPAGEYSIRYKVLTDGQVDLHIQIPYGAEANLILSGEEQKLSFGSHHYVFRPDTDLIHPFSVDTKVCELLENEKTAAVLKQIIPSLYLFLANNETGMEGSSFRVLCTVGSFAVPQESFELLNKKLNEIVA